MHFILLFPKTTPFNLKETPLKKWGRPRHSPLGKGKELAVVKASNHDMPRGDLV